MTRDHEASRRSSRLLTADPRTRELFLTTLGRLILLYFAPLLLLAVFFHLQYRKLVEDSLRAHLLVIAEHQAHTFDLFLRERLVNLANLVDDPRFPYRQPTPEALEEFLVRLQQASDAFVDLGVVSWHGDLVAYAGPVHYASPVNYQYEDWFRQLLEADQTWVITEIYLGFRDQPHFTLAVRRGEGQEAFILRSALSPERLADFLANLEGAQEVHAAIVNPRGILQVATPRVGRVLQPSPFTPPREPPKGFVERHGKTDGPSYAYAWLSQTPWALIVTSALPSEARAGLLPRDRFFWGTVVVFLLMGIVILVRTRQVVGKQIAQEEHEAQLSGQLVQAAKLASVGELAAGIAHEINNPLAIIAEEVGLLKDSLDPELAQEGEVPPDLVEHLDAIHDAVFRCRDITRKLLTFVRQTEVRLELHRIEDILNDVLDVMLGNELNISNVQVIRQYDPSVPPLLTDRNQLIQVFVNLVKNAIDAMPGGGTLTVTTACNDRRVIISVRDTGIGMTKEQMEKVFLPFFTTKEPGKGTGLGLSVSYSIIQNFGGAFYVDSAPGKGSVFTVELPISNS